MLDMICLSKLNKEKLTVYCRLFICNGTTIHARISAEYLDFKTSLDAENVMMSDSSLI